MIGPEHSTGKMPHVLSSFHSTIGDEKVLFFKVENLDLGWFWKCSRLSYVTKVLVLFNGAWGSFPVWYKSLGPTIKADNLCYFSMVPGDLFRISGILKKEWANHVQETSL